MDITPIVARLSVIANAVNTLKELQNLTYEEFITDHILNAAAERHFQVAIQAAIDIGSIVISQASNGISRNYKEIFLRLGEMGILPTEFSKSMAKMAQFRNVLVHLYLEVDLKKVYHYLQHNLNDFELFAQYISKYLETLE